MLECVHCFDEAVCVLYKRSKTEEVLVVGKRGSRTRWARALLLGVVVWREEDEEVEAPKTKPGVCRCCCFRSRRLVADQIEGVVPLEGVQVGV